MKDIHFYESAWDIPDGSVPYHGWREAEQAIREGVPEIATTQMGLLSTELIVEHGYRVFVHPADGDPYEIQLGGECTCTGKELRPAHNLFRMWQAGAFHAGAYDPKRPPWKAGA